MILPVPDPLPMDEPMKRLYRFSPTIARAVRWGGPQTPEEKAERLWRMRADRLCVDMILAGNPDPERVLSAEAFKAWVDNWYR